ncbi:MAG: TlpA disulfide reductase family protein [Candidatus Caldarchaeum sp.]
MWKGRLLIGLLLALGLAFGISYVYLTERAGAATAVTKVTKTTAVTTLTKLPETSQTSIKGSNIGPYEGMTAPDFAVETVDGERLQLSRLRGRTVVLWFMATWCPSCKSVASIIKSVAGKDVQVIVVDMWTEDLLNRAGLLGRTQPEKAEDLRKFIKDYGDEDWVLVMDNWWLTGLYELRYVDSLFVIDSDGRIVLRSDGPVTPSALRQSL